MPKASPTSVQATRPHLCWPNNLTTNSLRICRARSCLIDQTSRGGRSTPGFFPSGARPASPLAFPHAPIGANWIDLEQMRGTCHGASPAKRHGYAKIVPFWLRGHSPFRLSNRVIGAHSRYDRIGIEASTVVAKIGKLAVCVIQAGVQPNRARGSFAPRCGYSSSASPCRCSERPVRRSCTAAISRGGKR